MPCLFAPPDDCSSKKTKEKNHSWKSIFHRRKWSFSFSKKRKFGFFFSQFFLRDNLGSICVRGETLSFLKTVEEDWKKISRLQVVKLKLYPKIIILSLFLGIWKKYTACFRKKICKDQQHLDSFLFKKSSSFVLPKSPKFLLSLRFIFFSLILRREGQNYFLHWIFEIQKNNKILEDPNGRLTIYSFLHLNFL